MTSDPGIGRITPVRFVAFLTALVFACSLPVSAAGGGGSGTDDGSGDTMTWVSIGLVVIVGGLLFLDVLAGPDGVPLDSSEPDAIEPLDTGVDWDSLFPAGAPVLTVGVSAIHEPDGDGIASALIGLLSSRAPDGIVVYGDPVDLGEGDVAEQAVLASAYLGVDLLVAWTPAGDGRPAHLSAATPEGIVLSIDAPADSAMTAPADSVLRAASLLLDGW